jgi:hypothetical protein
MYQNCCIEQDEVRPGVRHACVEIAPCWLAGRCFRVHAALQFGYANLVGVGVVVQLRGLPIPQLLLTGGKPFYHTRWLLLAHGS